MKTGALLQPHPAQEVRRVAFLDGQGVAIIQIAGEEFRIRIGPGGGCGVRFGRFGANVRGIIDRRRQGRHEDEQPLEAQLAFGKDIGLDEGGRPAPAQQLGAHFDLAGQRADKGNLGGAQGRQVRLRAQRGFQGERGAETAIGGAALQPGFGDCGGQGVLPRFCRGDDIDQIQCDVLLGLGSEIAHQEAGGAGTGFAVGGNGLGDNMDSHVP